jgi:UDP-2-acetamido-3-amino-2,3-dideoxy-glucuronate N-acetyltransferase
MDSGNVWDATTGDYLEVGTTVTPFIGANATVVCGHTLGQYSFVGAGAVVTRDVKDFALVVGNPARQIGWMCQCGERLQVERQAAVCGRCGSRHREQSGELVAE